MWGTLGQHITSDPQARHRQTTCITFQSALTSHFNSSVMFLKAPTAYLAAGDIAAGANCESVTRRAGLCGGLGGGGFGCNMSRNSRVTPTTIIDERRACAHSDDRKSMIC